VQLQIIFPTACELPDFDTDLSRLARACRSSLAKSVHNVIWPEMPGPTACLRFRDHVRMVGEDFGATIDLAQMKDAQLIKLNMGGESFACAFDASVIERLLFGTRNDPWSDLPDLDAPRKSAWVRDIEEAESEYLPADRVIALLRGHRKFPD
jgi:hypothetical protein